MGHGVERKKARSAHALSFSTNLLSAGHITMCRSLIDKLKENKTEGKNVTTQDAMVNK